MIHFLTIGLFSSDAYFNERQLRALGILDKKLVDSLIEMYGALPEEFTFEKSESEEGYRSITLRYLPPTSVNALRVASDLCSKVPGCLAIDKSHPKDLAPEDFYPGDAE